MRLEKEIKRYSKLNGYPISVYRELKCECGSLYFKLYSDDEEGGAFTKCSTCEEEYDIESSRCYIKNQIYNICSCENENLLVGIGKALYVGSNKTRWVYIGAGCEKCDLVGVYVDWKVN